MIKVWKSTHAFQRSNFESLCLRSHESDQQSHSLRLHFAVWTSHPAILALVTEAQRSLEGKTFTFTILNVKLADWFFCMMLCFLYCGWRQAYRQVGGYVRDFQPIHLPEWIFFCLRCFPFLLFSSFISCEEGDIITRLMAWMMIMGSVFCAVLILIVLNVLLAISMPTMR